MLSETAYETIKKQFTLHLSVRSGWFGGGITDEKGGSRKRGGQDPLTPPPPSGHAYDGYQNFSACC